MSAELDKIKVKIAALLAKAESTEHEGEALVFMAKVQELLAEYQLTIYDLKEPDTLGMSVGIAGQPGGTSYKTDLQCQLANYYGAKPMTIFDGSAKGTGWHIEIVGPESCRITTLLMTQFVWEQVNLAAKRMQDRGEMKKDKANREIAKALCLRIRRLIADRKLQTPPAVTTGSPFALVTVDAIQAKFEELYPNSYALKSKSKKILSSAMEEAKNISLHHQTGGRKQLRLQ